MERAPLPPHERSWRHPSEVAAAARRSIVDERPSTTARTAALTGGTATILLVGIVVFSLTPRGPGNPSAMSSSPVERIAIASLSVPAGATSTVATTAPAPAGLPASTTATVTDVVPTSTAHLPAPQSTLVTTPEPRRRPLVTEFGSDGLAVLPSSAIIELARSSASSPTLIVVTRHGGTIAVASVIDPGDGHGLAVVHFDDSSTVRSGHGEGYDVATEPLGHDDVVTVMTDEPITVELGMLPSMSVTDTADGIAVLDEDGHLVGLYVGDDEASGGGTFIPIDVSLGDATATTDRP